MDTTLRAAAFLDKGSVGKTTTIAHVGVALSDEGHRVCLLDLTGKQGDLTKHFSLWQQVLESDEWPNITTVFHSLYANSTTSAVGLSCRAAPIYRLWYRCHRPGEHQANGPFGDFEASYPELYRFTRHGRATLLSPSKTSYCNDFDSIHATCSSATAEVVIGGVVAGVESTGGHTTDPTSTL